MAKAIHSMIRVLDEARAVEFYDRAFGLKVETRLDFPAFNWSTCATRKPTSSLS